MALLSCVGALQTVRAAGTAYYVDSVSGSDSNAGTSSSAPLQTLNKVNSLALQAGDIINFKRGSAWTGTLYIKSSGAASSPVTYQAYGTGTAPQITAPSGSYTHAIEVTGDYNTIQNFLISNASEAGVLLRPGADHNIVQQNEIYASGTGVMAGGQYNLMKGNYVHDLRMIVNDSAPNNDYGAVCFWLYGPNNEVSYNHGVNCVAPSYDFGYDGGFVEVFNSGDNTYVHHNFADNTNGFFELGGTTSTSSAANVKVAYNVMNSGDGAVCLNTGSYNINISNFTFENNTFIATGNRGYRVFQCRNDLTPLRVVNNIFYSNVQIANNGNFNHTNNVYYMTNMINGSGVGYGLSTGEKSANPMFVNQAGKDYHLQAGSPAIDAGVYVGFNSDLDGHVVPQGGGPDAGAYEYGSSTTSDVTPPSVPTSVAATAVSSAQVSLTWSASTDNVAVTSYVIYRNGARLATVTGGTSYSDGTVAASTTYTYNVAASDVAGNVSAQSAPASVTVPAAAAPVSGTNLVRGLLGTTNAGFVSGAGPTFATDGSYATYPYTEVATNLAWLRFDLGSSVAVNRVALWHYYGDGRTYHDVIVQLSNDPSFASGVTTVFNNDTNNSAGQGVGRDAEYAETSAGKSISFNIVNARYVRLWSNGSSVNYGNHYVEVEVYGSGPSATATNVARGIVPTSNVGFTSTHPATSATDGNTATSNYAEVAGVYRQFIQVDLGRAFSVSRIKLWHYYGDGRTYHDVIVWLSNDPNFANGVTTVFNNDTNNSSGLGSGSDVEYAETSAGKEIVFAPTSARYVRFWTNGSTANLSNHYVEAEVYGL